MQIIVDLASLHPGRCYWVPAVSAPVRNWAGAPGCRRGARFLLDQAGHPARRGFPAFESRAECLRWIMAHRLDISDHAPDAPVTAARLDAWMLGLDRN
jgi:hypothetical protein